MAGAQAPADDLQFVEFEAGRAEVGEAGQRKLETMTRALKGRPGLTLEVSARLDAERDLKALRSAALARALASEGKPVDDAAYPNAVRAAYARAKLPGDPQQMSVAAMETGLMDSLRIGDEELRALSRSRAEAVRNYLVEKGGLAAERVVVAEAASGASGAVKAQASRVDFALR